MYQLTFSKIRACSQSTSSAAASRVRTSRQPGEVRALRAAGRVYGERCLGLSGKSDPLGSSLRTYLRSSCEELTGLSLRWKESVTPAGHWWLVLGRSARRTDGIGPGLSGDFPTPQASDAVGGKGVRLQATETGMMPDGSKATIGLRDKVLRSWPTATVADASGHSQTAENPTPKQTGGTTLVGAVKAQVEKQWPTPSKMDADRGAESRETKQSRGSGGVNLREACNWPGCSASDANHKGDLVQAARGNQNKHFGPAGQAVQANPSTTGKPRGSLNSAWVRSLLGWPDEYWIALEKATMEYHLTAPRAARTKASCG